MIHSPRKSVSCLIPGLFLSPPFMSVAVWNISFSYTAFRPTFSSLAAPHKQEVHLKCCKLASFYIKYEASFTVALHEGVSTQPSHNGSQYSKTSKQTMNCKPLAVKQLFRLSTNLFNQRKTEPATHELCCSQVRADANHVREKRLHQPKQFTNRVSEEAGTWWVISRRHCDNDGVKWGEREKANGEWIISLFIDFHRFWW